MESAIWDIEPGKKLPRREVHDRYGGNRRGGIAPCAETPNVLIFTDPEKADENAYPFDGWVDATLLHYTGEGKSGDQRFVHGNRAIRDHQDERRALRVFRAKSPDATYLGEFEVDTDLPYRLGDCLGVDGLMRQAIAFRLRPVGHYVDGGLPSVQVLPAGEQPVIVEVTTGLPEPGVTEVPPEDQHVEGYTASRTDEPIEYRRREAALVKRYEAWLDDRGRPHHRHRLRPPGELTDLWTDLFDAGIQELIEAKASSSRASIRTGLGQLLDYERFVSHNLKSLLLPTAPRPDLMALLKAYGCGCIWETETGQFERSDPSVGAS